MNAGDQEWVSGYTKKDGTTVEGFYRQRKQPTGYRADDATATHGRDHTAAHDDGTRTTVIAQASHHELPATGDNRKARVEAGLAALRRRREAGVARVPQVYAHDVEAAAGLQSGQMVELRSGALMTVCAVDGGLVTVEDGSQHAAGALKTIARCTGCGQYRGINHGCPTGPWPPGAHEVRACVDDGAHVISGVDDADADFFTLYRADHEGFMMAVDDYPTRKEAETAIIVGGSRVGVTNRIRGARIVSSDDTLDVPRGEYTVVGREDDFHQVRVEVDGTEVWVDLDDITTERCGTCGQFAADYHRCPGHAWRENDLVRIGNGDTAWRIAFVSGHDGSVLLRNNQGTRTRSIQANDVDQLSHHTTALAEQDRQAAAGAHLRALNETAIQELSLIDNDARARYWAAVNTLHNKNQRADENHLTAMRSAIGEYQQVGDVASNRCGGCGQYATAGHVCERGRAAAWPHQQLHGDLDVSDLRNVAGGWELQGPNGTWLVRPKPTELLVGQVEVNELGSIRVARYPNIEQAMSATSLLATDNPAGAVKCDTCGQFMGAGHSCPDRLNQAIDARGQVAGLPEAKYGDLKGDERVKAMVADLEQSVQAIVDSGQLNDWLSAMASNGMSRWSANNRLLAMVQMWQRGGDLNGLHLMGFRQWEKLNRKVTKGAKAIWILAPITRKVIEDDEETHRVVGFKGVPVFDVSDTSGDPLPGPPLTPVPGEATPGTLQGLRERVATAGYSYEEVEIPDCRPGTGEGTLGYTDPKTKKIVVDGRLSNAQKASTIAHELGHVHCGHVDGAYSEYQQHRGKFETEAEAAAFLTMSARGASKAQVGAFSPGYIAAWSKGEATVLRGALDKAVKAHNKIMEGEWP